MEVLKFDNMFKQPFFNFWLLGIKQNLELRYIMLFCCITLMVIEESFFFFLKISSSDSFLEVTALAPCLGIGVLSMLKISCIVFKRRKIYHLHDSLKEMYNKILVDERKIDLVMGKMRIVHKFTKYNIVLNYVLVSMYNFLSLVLILYDYKVKGEIVYYLPYAVTVPFSTDTFWNWLLVYIHSIGSAYLCVVYFLTADSLYYNLSVHLCCNFTILGDEIQRLKPHNVGSLSEIVKKHQHILKLSEDLEDIFAAPNLYNVLVGSIQICALGFNLMTGELKRIPVFALFLFSQILLIFFMSVFGEDLIRESGKIAKKVYLCEWYNMDKKAKKTLLLIMTRANKPQKLTSYKFSTICYESFMKIISTSWSYFTILRTVYYSSENE